LDSFGFEFSAVSFHLKRYDVVDAVSLLLSLAQGIFHLAEQQSLIALCSLMKNRWLQRKKVY